MCIPAEEEEVWAREEHRDHGENILTSEGARNTAENHRYNDAVGDKQHRLDWTGVLHSTQRTPHYLPAWSCSQYCMNHHSPC